MRQAIENGFVAGLISVVIIDVLATIGMNLTSKFDPIAVQLQ